ncbi:MAG: DEAD/DEAH box helicase, partial [Euryarchaeota archaeon]|nr:DEAD/DEAH box helicase [Euryarchaeota archaeon]
MFVRHPLIKPNSIEKRDYQRTLANICLKSSTLVVVPTGMGKTIVALLVLADVLTKHGGKILFLAPTKPLVEQHARFLREHIVDCPITVLTGAVSPEEREVEWIQNRIIVSTPQVIANDLRNERISLRDVSLVIFDEAHRGVGNYSYVPIAEEYRDVNGLTMGMTASPGSSMVKIKEVCENLDIDNIEVRSESDPDVARYVHDIHMDWVEVEIPDEMRELSNLLRKLFDRCIKSLIDMRLMTPARPASRRYLLEVQANIQVKLNSGEKSGIFYRALSLIAMAIKVDHAVEMVETQGLTALRNYIVKLEEDAASEDGTKASRSIVNSEEFQKLLEIIEDLHMEHPKISRIMSIVSHQLNEKPGSRVLVFTQYRDTCDLVANYLSRIDGASVTKLIGQSGRCGERGLRQREQIEVLQNFRDGEFNTLVATSVGEEGLDVANTDLVIFYEPVPSEIRSIQRRGRTGRSRAGQVII